MEKLASPVWRAPVGAAANAQRELPRLVSGYFRAGREFLAAQPSPAELHALRLATKRLRYTLELFRRCYGRALDRYLAGLHDVQQALGELNDCVATRNLLAREMPPSPLHERIERFLSGLEAGRSRQFRRLWTERFDAPGREKAWCGYLARRARSRGEGKS